MSDVTSIKQASYQEAEAGRIRSELRKATEENNKEYQQKITEHTQSMDRLSTTYDKEANNQKTNLERDLNIIRAKFAELKKKENDRFESEIKDLKQSHEDQKGELVINHTEEISRMDKSHKNFLENARQKFEAEKAKYQTA